MDRKNKRAAHHQQQAQPPLSIGQGQQQAINLQHGLHDPRQQQINRPLLQHSSSGRGLFEMSNGVVMGAGRHGIEEGSSSRNFIPSFPPPPHQIQQQQQQHREVDLLFGVPDDLQATGMHQSMLNTAPSQSSIGAFRPELRSNYHQGDEAETFNSRHSPERSFEAIGRSTSQAFGTSPFSHPGSHSVFYSTDAGESSHSMTKKDNQSGLQTATARNPWQIHESNDINEEDFLPSSLTELLTPAELLRRGRMGFNKATGDFTPQSLPARTTLSTSPWETNTSLQGQQWKHSPQQGSLFNDGEEGSLSYARERLARNRAAVAVPTNALPSPSYLQNGSSNLGISNTSAGFLSSRLRRGLSSGLMDKEVDGLEARPSDAYSPGAQAALSHAPGQSLPQGLAAGLSSLHLRSGSGNEEGGLGKLHNYSPSNSIWNHQTNNGYSQGGYGKANDELGPTAPSSVFAHRNNPLQMAMARSLGGSGSASTSLDAFHPSGSHQGGGGGGGGGLLSISNNGGIMSPYARSPANRNEGGIAIPSNSESPSSLVGSLGNATNSNRSSNKNNNINFHNNTVNNTQHKSITNHPGKNRIRNAGIAVGSPLALPTTGEEVEEPIFELE